MRKFVQRGLIFCKEWSSIYRQENSTVTGGGFGEDVFYWLDEVLLVDVVFDGAFGGVEDEEVVVGEGVVVTSSSLEMLTNSCLGGIMVSLIFLEGLEEEALVEFMVELFEEDEDGKKNEKDGLFNLKANDQSRKS
ncbi:hypothetical protein Tco_1501712 [Tanacetum coccineum]